MTTAPAIPIRPERPGDAPVIAEVIRQAFLGHPFSAGTEAGIVEALRRSGALTISLVAGNDEVLGHVAFSAVTISDGVTGWFGLGPVAVRPDHQRRGLGRALVSRGLDALRSQGAGGCVVLGEPAYYGRFGFAADPGLRLPGAPEPFFLALPFRPPMPRGEVAYHPAFSITA